MGQSSFEEVNLIERGGNYGWNLKEGRRSYSRSKGQRVKLVDPVFDYGRQRGQSITGGYVYRGRALSGLSGAYIYGDFSSRRLWALTMDGPKLKAGARLGRAPCQIASFAEDRDGELYVICLQGRILSILDSFVGQ